VNSFLSKFLPVTIRQLLILMEVPFLESCGSPNKRVPSIDVFGSYFPAWLMSLAAGIMLTAIAVGVGRLIDIRPSGFPGFLVAVSLILIFSISVWFWFFTR
jgi:uncharacterized membrane protein YhaH (DUF805 family)